MLSIFLVGAAFGVSLLLPVAVDPPASPVVATPAVAFFVVPSGDGLKMRHKALVEYVSDRWDLDIDVANKIIGAADSAAKAESVDPLLILSIIATESTFMHIGNAGNLNVSVDLSDIDPLEPHGLMQVSGRWHPEKMPLDKFGRIRVTTAVENIFIGTKVIGEYLRREGGNLTRALQRYNGNLSDTSSRYAANVLRFRKQFQQALLDS